MMKTNFKFSSRMHLFIIISSVVIAIGLAVGLICQFVSNGFFSYGGSYASYQEITVTYFDKEISQQEVKTICEEAFEEQGVSYYITPMTSGSSTNSRIEYRFTQNADSSALKAAAETIQTELQQSWELSTCSYANVSSVLGGGRDIMYAGIGLAAAVVFQFLYFLIRYRLTMALAAFLADVHNLALFYALLAITRLQVSLWVVAMSVFVVILTMMCCSVLFGKMRKNFKSEAYKAMSSFEQSDSSASECFKAVSLINASLAAMFALILVFTAIGALSVYGLFMPCMAAILAVIVCEYGTMFFLPSVFSRFKMRADKSAEKKASKYVGAKKSAKVA